MTTDSWTPTAVMWVVFVVQAFTNLFGFAWLGLVLKWPLVYGIYGHAHPHEDYEFYVWGPNNYLNVAITAVAMDMFEPLFLACVWGRGKSQIHWCGRYCFFLYSWICIVLIGALCGVLIPISMTRTPPQIKDSPYRPREIYTEAQVYVLVAVAVILVACKLVSYWLGLVYAILRIQPVVLR